MERLGVVSFNDAVRGMKAGDVLMINLAGCVQSFQKRLSKTGKPFAFLKLSDTSTAYEGLLFSDGISRYENAIQSGVPLFLQAKLEKQTEDLPPRILFNVIKTMDETITENSKGLVIYIDNVAAVAPLRQLLSREHFGPNKIYLKPELEEWDARIQLKDGYALDNGNLLTAIRAIPGISLVKEV